MHEGYKNNKIKKVNMKEDVRERSVNSEDNKKFSKKKKNSCTNPTRIQKSQNRREAETHVNNIDFDRTASYRS